MKPEWRKKVMALVDEAILKAKKARIRKVLRHNRAGHLRRYKTRQALYPLLVGDQKLRCEKSMLLSETIVRQIERFHEGASLLGQAEPESIAEEWLHTSERKHGTIYRSSAFEQIENLSPATPNREVYRLALRSLAYDIKKAVKPGKWSRNE